MNKINKMDKEDNDVSEKMINKAPVDIPVEKDMFDDN